MLIEQTIELQLRGPGSPGRTNTPITGYCHDKAKISEENLRVDYYLLFKRTKKQSAFTSSYLDQITYN